MMLPECPLQIHIINCKSKIWYASRHIINRNIHAVAFRVLDRHSMHETNANPLECISHHLRIPRPRPRKPPPRPLPPMALAAASPCALSDYISLINKTIKIRSISFSFLVKTSNCRCRKLRLSKMINVIVSSSTGM